MFNNNKNNKQIKIPDFAAKQIGRYEINNFTISIKDFGRKCELLLYGERQKEQNVKTIEYGKKERLPNKCIQLMQFQYNFHVSLK